MAMTFDRPRSIRIARNVAIGLVALLIVVGVVGFFVAPGLVRSVAEQQILEQTGRRAAIGSVKLNPYTLSATLGDFKVFEVDGSTVAVQVDELVANVSSASLFKRALVFDELRVAGPHLRFARLDAQHYSFSDVVDRLLAKPKTDSTFHFSVNNIRIDGGTIDFDDRVTGRKHRIEGLRVGIPFISNLPYDTDIFVTPDFAARVNGSAIELTGKVLPFASTRETAVELDIGELDLPTYADFAPLPLAFKVASGKLASKLALRFRAAGRDAEGKATASTIDLSGQVGLKDLKLTDRGGRTFFTLHGLDADIARLDPLRGDADVRSIAIDRPHVEATRRNDGSIDLIALLVPKPSSAPTAAASASTKAPVVTLASIKLADGSVRFIDQVPAPTATTVVNRIRIVVTALTLGGEAPSNFDATVALEDGATIATKGSATIGKRSVTGTLAVKGLRPASIAPYLASYVVARIDDGQVDADAHYRLVAAGDMLAGRIDALTLRIAKLRTSLPGDKASLLGADEILLSGGSFDLGTRAFTAESLKLTAPAIVIKRDAKGSINLSAALVETKPSQTSSPQTSSTLADKPVAVTVKPENAAAFTAVLKTFEIERGDVSFEDAAVRTPVRVRMAPLNLKAENVGTALGSAVPFDLTAVVEKRGKLAVKGKVAVAPLSLEATVEANQLPVGWLAGYAGDRLNITVDSADLNAKGALRVAQGASAGKSTAGRDTLRVGYKGSAGVVRLRAVDRVTSDEFMRWKTLDIPSVDFQMPGRDAAPLSLALGTVSLSDFYARVIVNANGRLNLQDVVSKPGEQQSVTTPESTPSATPSAAPTALPAKRDAQSPAPANAKPASTPSIRVAGVKLTAGRIGFTDNFVKPNYSANLTDLAGTVSALASDGGTPADVRVQGKIDGDGALDISGKLDPFATALFVDIAAEAKDIELTRLTPYAVKYAGYPIERGKLSTTVKYHIENGKLDAQNRLFLDQLTFGEKDASSSANLPVRLAVALLKNSKGEIDINLPVSGSLSDPQFSIGGVIFRALLNLIGRAVTSPFALIGSAFGGGGSGGELGYIQFMPGVSDLTPQGKQKLETLAKALADRPQLKLDIIGRYDPATDAEGIRRDHLLDRLKDLKAKDVSKNGERVGRDDVTLAPEEYPKYLARVYDDAKLPDKPRNVIGLAKTVPVEEMERLLLASVKLDDNDPRWLAEARADVVRHYIEDTGKVPPSRVFLVAPKLDASGIKDDGKPNRVDFSLR